jgi:hypothetical protein
MPQHWREDRKIDENGPRRGDGHGVVFHSSEYDVYQVTSYRYDNTGTQEVYRAACCLILSPPGK